MDSGSVLLAGLCLNLKGQTVFSLKLSQALAPFSGLDSFTLAQWLWYVRLWSGGP